MMDYFSEFRLIVSVQASQGEPFYPLPELKAMITSVVNGGAQGLRLANLDAIIGAKQTWPELPIIGLTKPEPLPDNWQEIPYITPTLNDMLQVAHAGADIIAIDGTCRPRTNNETLLKNIASFKQQYPNRLIMGDIATIEDAQHAINAGCDILGTTLSGYTQQSQPATTGPDFKLLQELTRLTEKPVILEGRIWHPEEVAKAQELGAHGVVIGSAITRPHQITQRFLERMN